MFVKSIYTLLYHWQNCIFKGFVCDSATVYQSTLCTPNKDDMNMLYSFTKLNNARTKYLAYRSLTPDELSSSFFKSSFLASVLDDSDSWRDRDGREERKGITCSKGPGLELDPGSYNKDSVSIHGTCSTRRAPGLPQTSILLILLYGTCRFCLVVTQIPFNHVTSLFLIFVRFRSLLVQTRAAEYIVLASIFQCAHVQ